MAVSRITELASIIAAKTTEIDNYTIAERLPSPSFDADIPPDLLLTPTIAASRQAILEATDELHALMLGPAGILMPSHNDGLSLQAIYRFGLAKKFPANANEVSFSEMASRTGLQEHMIQRLVHHAASHHIFRESRKGYFAHTAASRMLAENGPIHEWVGMTLEEMWAAATKTVEALVRWPDAQEPNQTGFNLAHGTELTIFEELGKYPERAHRYAEAMAWFNTGPAMDPIHLLENYSWDSVRTVVDVGGGYGSVSLALVQRYPSLRCVVQDRPEIVAEAQARLPHNFDGRLSFMEHDFFTEQPVVDADVFFFRWILHDWSDKYAIRILCSLIPALKSGTRVVVNECVLPEPGSVSSYREKLSGRLDMAMLEIHNGKERDSNDWKELFESADRRFQFSGITLPASSRLAVIEFVWSG